ncbi:hypothetical protein [Pectinatus haikarae]|uniref:Uncharacterized protein n=1 Tax=Pectinatus haikarae TaxID=349096 RepID=A0ABT9Y5E9_9FIRM|nr:hypothetical protein [Pectinatus haikarae]MDQ0202858.1 hypothetical protein [Pectinatus haikarae]
MRKFLLLIVFISMTTVSAICAAQIPQEEVALGGINLGATPEYVKSVYGEPSSYIRSKNGVIYDYNSTFRIYFASGKYMYWLETTANNGIATPSGVTIGMDASILYKYGEIYLTEHEGNTTYYSYWAPGRITLIFGVQNGKIISIKGSCMG